jgi:hypothetical protein
LLILAREVVFADRPPGTVEHFKHAADASVANFVCQFGCGCERAIVHALALLAP